MDPNEKLTGIASLPQNGPQGMPMGGVMPPMPQQGMSGPPPMPMGGEQPPMEPEMGGEQPPMNVEQDAMMLAEAVVGRTQGDIGAAVDVLDTAKAMLISSGNQEPQMMNMGGPLYAKDGLDLTNKRTLSNSDTDILRQMIMDSLQIQEGRSLSDKDLEFFMDLQGQSGRTLSNKDLAALIDTGRTMSDIDWSKLKNISPSYRLYEKMTGENIPASTQTGKRMMPQTQTGKRMMPPVSRAGGGSLMTDAQKYREAIKQARMVS